VTEDPRQDVASSIVVLGGNPDAAELAAITAVVTGMLEELAEEQGGRELSGPSAWERSQRAIRTPLRPGPDRWRGFSA